MKRALRVVIVDDEEEDFLILSDLLSCETSFEVQADWIQDATDAVERILREAYDIVFMDYQLGLRSGLALTRDLRAMDCDVPVVMVTGHANPGMERAAMHAGVDFFIDKELASESLLSTTLHFALRRRQASDTLNLLHHPLTRLPSRWLFTELLDAFCRTAPLGTQVAYGVLEINLQPVAGAAADLYAFHHAWRDLLLRLDAGLGSHGVAGHLGQRCVGVVLLTNPESPVAAEERERVMALATAPLRAGDLDWEASCASGWADGRAGRRAADLLEEAWAALGRNQGVGKGDSTAAEIERDYHRVALLVDDNKVNRVLGMKLLGNLGIRADGAASGEDALDMVRRTPYDVIFMDLEMPGMDGFEVVSEIRAQRLAATPVVALTGREDENIIAQCRAVHMNGYMTKPLSRGALVRTLDRLFLV